MHKTKVVDLGRVRDLKAEWGKVAEQIARGRVDSFSLVVKDADGVETIYLGGVYKTSPRTALKAAMRVSAFMMLDEEEEGPLFRASQL